MRFRIDGVLQDITTVPRKMAAGVVSRVKIMAELDIAEKRLPQDGRIGLVVDGRHIDLRVVTLPSVHGEGIVMRILDKSNVVVDLDELGMADEARATFETSCGETHGAVLVTGPTGSGQVDDALRRAAAAQHAREEHHHGRGPGRVRNVEGSPRCRSTRPA